MQQIPSTYNLAYTQHELPNEMKTSEIHTSTQHWVEIQSFNIRITLLLQLFFCFGVNDNLL